MNHNFNSKQTILSHMVKQTSLLYIDPLKKKFGSEFLNQTTHKAHLKKKIGSQFLNQTTHKADLHY